MIADYTIQNSTFTIQHSYTWGMDLSGSMQGAGGVAGLLAVEEVSNLLSYYPTFDGNGNVSEYLDSSSAVQAHYEYDAFGNITVATGTKKDDFAHRFSTKPQDAETGLYYYGYRYYDPTTGRWPSRDPIGEDGGENLYAFVGNDAIDFVDYLGMERADELEHMAQDNLENVYDKIKKGLSDGAKQIAESDILKAAYKDIKQIGEKAKKACSENASAASHLVHSFDEEYIKGPSAKGGFKVYLTQYVNGIPVLKHKLGDVSYSIKSSIRIKGDVWVTCCCDPESKEWRPYIKAIFSRAALNADGELVLNPKIGFKRKKNKNIVNKEISLNPIIFETPCDQGE